jgi:hypothetical protein
MKKAVIQMEERHVNIPADRMVQDGDYLYLYIVEDELVGMVRWELIPGGASFRRWKVRCMKQIISLNKRVVCTTTVPYPPEAIMEKWRAAGRALSELEAT